MDLISTIKRKLDFYQKPKAVVKVDVTEEDMEEILKDLISEDGKLPVITSQLKTFPMYLDQKKVNKIVEIIESEMNEKMKKKYSIIGMEAPDKVILRNDKLTNQGGE